MEELQKEMYHELNEYQKAICEYFQLRAEELRLQSEGLEKEFQIFINKCARELNVPPDWQFNIKEKRFVNPQASIEQKEEVETDGNST